VPSTGTSHIVPNVGDRRLTEELTLLIPWKYCSLPQGPVRTNVIKLEKILINSRDVEEKKLHENW